MPRIAFVLAALLSAPGAPTPHAGVQRGSEQERLSDALRRESAAVVELADAALSGRPVPADLALVWRNDFFKARPGTFVPFTLSFTAPALSARAALLYVRVERRDQAARPGRASAPARPFAYEAIFPVRIEGRAGDVISFTRGFAVPSGAYRVILALRESPDEAPGRGDPSPRKAGVLIQELDVPDFWTGELATSTLMLANRVERLDAPVRTDELDEDPYAVGTTRIHVTPERVFTRDRELIVAFLIYNPAVAADRHFDVQVDYHLYKRDPGKADRYVTRTSPQRFNPAMIGAQFDPAAGTPVLAGQGILLSAFEPGDYRLGVTITDLLSRKTLTRAVIFTVAGS